MVPHLPTCRRSVKRISVNFALLCLSDIMIKMLKESQFTVESESHGERLLLIFDAFKMGLGSLTRLQSMLQPILFLFKNMPTTTQPAKEQQQVHI